MTITEGSTLPKPAESLLGLTLNDGWLVTHQFSKPPVGSKFTGGAFSCGYIATQGNGNEGFVKALDFSHASKHSRIKKISLADVLKDFFDHYVFERDLSLSAKHLSRIVTAVGHGEITINENDPANTTVYYIIYEMADGDIRRHLSQTDFDAAWNLWALHDIAVGLNQLHGAGVAHLDTKPSNTLVFNDAANVKLADLGCACVERGSSPRGHYRIAGDVTYAPVELLYRNAPINDLYRNFEWNARRQGCDLYHLGNMAVFLFGDTHVNALLEDQLPFEYHWDCWEGTYDEVLPFLKRAFADAIDLLATDIPAPICAELCELIRALCHPDPAERGWKSFKRGHRNPYSVEPFVGRLSTLASKASRGIRIKR